MKRRMSKVFIIMLAFALILTSCNQTQNNGTANGDNVGGIGDFFNFDYDAQNKSSIENDEIVNVGEITYKEVLNENIVYDEAQKFNYVDNQILITVKEDVSRTQIQKIATDISGIVVGGIELTGDYQIELDEKKSLSQINQITYELNNNELIESAYVHTVDEVSFESTPNDKEWKNLEWSADFPEQENWGVEAIDAMGAWDYIDQMETVNVGIIDSMFDTDHEDLNFEKVWNNPDDIMEEDLLYSIMAHGTHVAGTFVATHNNGIGISGVAPKTELYAYSILGEQTDEIVSDEDNNINYVSMMEWKYALANLITNNCKVINVSMERRAALDFQSETLGKFLQKLLNTGYDFVIVQAAGNASGDAVNSGLFTGIEIEEVRDRIIIVGAIGNNGSHKDGWFGVFGDRIFDGYNFADFSSFGERVDVVAPGVKIYSTVPESEYEDDYKVEKDGEEEIGDWSGTSMSAPHVAGVVAMCFSVNEYLTGKQVKEIVLSTTSATITDNNTGHEVRSYGLVDAKDAVQLAIETQVNQEIDLNSPDTGIVLGSVFELNSTSPTRIGDVSVSVQKINNNDENIYSHFSSTTTNSVGEYELTLETGTYNLTFYKVGYLPQTYLNVQVDQGETLVIETIKLMRSTSEDTKGSVKGKVTSTLNENLEGVQIVLRAGWNNVSMDISQEYSGATNSNGYYEIGDVFIGNYTAEYKKDGYTTKFANVICAEDGIEFVNPTVKLEGNNIKMGSLSGKVVQAIDRSTPIDKARISVYQNNLLIKTVYSNSNGDYQTSLPVGSYQIKISATNYIEFTTYAVVKENENTYMETFLMVTGSPNEKGVATGTIYNALTGQGMDEVLLEIRKDWNNNTAGDVVKSVKTDANGNYSIELPFGNYTMIVSKPGCVSTIVNIIVQRGTTADQNGTISPNVSGDDFRIVLSWGANPRDLDSHMYGSGNIYDKFHVFYANRNYEEDDINICNLDVDDISSYGPETITLKTINNKPYYYYVHKFSGTGSLATSQAKVNVYQGENLISTFNVPTNLGGSEYWNVFAIKNGELIVNNTITTTPNRNYAN